MYIFVSLNLTQARKHKVFLRALSCPPKPEPRTVENKEKKHKTRPALTRNGGKTHRIWLASSQVEFFFWQTIPVAK